MAILAGKHATSFPPLDLFLNCQSPVRTLLHFNSNCAVDTGLHLPLDLRIALLPRDYRFDSSHEIPSTPGAA